MSEHPAHVIGFDICKTSPKVTVTDDPALVDKPYESRSWRCFQSPGKGAMAGIWEAEPHLERCACDYDEMCHILEGEVVVAAGFRGTWENLTAVRKVFFILS